MEVANITDLGFNIDRFSGDIGEAHDRHNPDRKLLFTLSTGRIEVIERDRQLLNARITDQTTLKMVLSTLVP